MGRGIDGIRVWVMEVTVVVGSGNWLSVRLFWISVCWLLLLLFYVFLISLFPPLSTEKTLAMSPMHLGDAGAPIHVHLNSPITPSFYSFSGGNGERGRMSSSEQDRGGGGTSSGPGSPVRGERKPDSPAGLNGNGSINGHGHGHYPDLNNNINLNSNVSIKRLSTGPHPLLPRELVSDIQRFAQSDFAKKYFATHKEGIFFKTRIPLEKMMSWQKVRRLATITMRSV